MDENYYHTASGWRPTVGWDREVIYLRPKVFVIYDRTNKLNKAAAPAETFTQKMTFNVGKTPVTSAYGSGMFRSEVDNAGTYKGALTHILPAGMASPSATNLGGYGLVYQIASAPAAETQYVNWLTVADAADATGNLETVAPFATHSNADVIRIGDDIVVGFTSQQNGAAAAYPLTYTMAGMGAGVTHYICGLSASTTYYRTVSGNDVTLATTVGGTSTVSTAAGCITFTSGSVPAGPVVISTSSPMPAGTVGTAYSQTISATGGDGGPYTCAVSTGAFPTSLTLNANCTVTGTPTVAETAAASVIATDGLAVDSAAKSLSITIAGNAPTITTSSLPNGTDDTDYTTQICASGGVLPYTFSKFSGTYCAGLSLTAGSPCATLSGTTTTVESCSFTMRVTANDAQTDDQVYTIQINAAQTTNLTVRVAAGSNSANVVIGAVGMPYGTTCTVQIVQSDVAIKSNEELLRYASQRSTFSGLSPLTTYGAVVTCPNYISPATVTFTTVALEATAPVTVPIVLKPNALFPTATQVTIDYGIDSVAENTVTTACTSGCTVNLSLSAGIYIMRHIWKTAGGVALGTSGGRELIVP